MEPSINSRSSNDKSPIKLLPGACNISGSNKLDNNSNHNNNESNNVQDSPFRGSHATTNPFCNTDDNIQTSPVQRNSSYLENLHNPWLSRHGNVRRHSVGIEDFSTLSAYGRTTNSNQEKRLPAYNPNTILYGSSDATPNCLSVANPAEIQCQSVRTENQNLDLDVRSPSNRCEETFNPLNFNRTQSFEKVKDKSFVRKSSLNRLDLVDQVLHRAANTSPQHQNNAFAKQAQLSSSEACSDKDQTKSPSGLPVGPNSKRKNSIGRRFEKNLPDGKEESGKNIDRRDERKGNWPHNLKHRDSSLKLRNRNPKMLFKKKAYSAGEQESFSDQGETYERETLCFSAQEISAPQVESISVKQNSTQPGSVLDSNCDKSSHNNESVCRASNSEMVLKDDNSPQQENGTADELPNINHLQIDKDLFNSQSFVKVTPLRPFPVDNSTACSPFPHENNEVTVPSLHHHTASVIDTGEEPSCLRDSAIVRNSSPIESDKESSRQPGSILRRKSQDDRREIHGILKNAEDKLASKQFSSILKHRESSEEKEVWVQSDLHSILKKSTSEDESSSNGPDIRPILKNTSTDDESSGLSSKPKPILKKRTSFSEECSYVCFKSNELKPILKKKSILEMPEDQPKPILKTRRKSEEATATTAEFPIGTRPRAYSADRGVCKVEKMKPNDDDLT